MATPHYIDENHKVILDKVNSADIDEAQKMYYRQLLDKSKDSTNGRTQSEKVQDITECLAGVVHLLITRNIDSKCTDQKLDEVKEELEEVKEDLEKNNELTNQLNTDHQCGGKYDIDSKIKQIEEYAKNRTKFDKLIDFLKNLPWSATVLGLGVCALLAFKPEIVSVIKSLF